MAKKKRKRKSKPRKPVPLSPAREAEKIKVYYDRLLEICDVFGAREVVEKLSTRDVCLIYALRFRIKVLGGETAKTFPGLVGAVRNVIDNAFLDDRSFTFPGYDTQISNREFFSHLLTLYHWHRTLDGKEPDFMKLVDEKLKPLTELCESLKNPERILESWLDIIGSRLTETPDQAMILLIKENQSGKNTKKPYMGIHITVQLFLTEHRKIRFEGRNETEVFKVYGWESGLAHEVYIKAENLSDHTLMRGLKLEVYMQRHALNRLNERLDLFTPTELYFYVSISVEQGDIISRGTNRGLLGYYFYGHLLGYLLIEVVDGVCVIRTFLFLTNDDTPQGKKLKELLKLNKLDKSYTGLDRLNTYVYGDLKEDRKLYGILKEADCGLLLNLKEELLKRATYKEVDFDVAAIKRYFEIDD